MERGGLGIALAISGMRCLPAPLSPPRDRRDIDGELPETLGRESIGLVLQDPQGLRAPQKYQQLEEFSKYINAGPDVEFELKIPAEDGRWASEFVCECGA